MYKPVRGERPLWDFPDGTLAGREVASYVVSAAGGWDVVPPTVLRDGPAGRGTVQLWIEGLDGTDDEDVVGRSATAAGRPGARRPDGAGLAAGVRGRAAHGSPVVVVHADRPRPGRGRGPRRRHQQRRPQGLAPACWTGTGPCGGSTTASASTRSSSCGPCSGAGRATPLPDVELSRLDGLAAALGTPTSSLAQALDAAARAGGARRPCARGWTGLLRTGPLPAARAPVARRPVAAAVTRPL